MTTLESVLIDDVGRRVLVRSPRLRAGLAVLAMDEIHEAIRHRRPDFSGPKVARAHYMLGECL